MKATLMVFPPKNVVWVKWAILGLNMIHLYDSGSTPVIIFIFLNKRDQKV